MTATEKHTLALMEALRDLLGDMPDMVATTNDRIVACRHCGREYPADDPPKDATECSDDCPGYIARAALALAEPPADEISLQDWTAAVVSNIPAYTPIRPGLLDTTRIIVAVDNEDENALAIRYAGDVAAEIKAADAHYKPITDALYQLHRRGTGLRDNILAPIKGEFDRLKCLSGAYQREREKADAAAKAAREAADAERRRIEAEAQGRTAEAEAAIEQAVEAAIEQAVEAMAEALASIAQTRSKIRRAA